MKSILILIASLSLNAFAISVRNCPDTLSIRLDSPVLSKFYGQPSDEFLKFFDDRGQLETTLELNYRASAKCHYVSTRGDKEIYSATIEGSLREGAKGRAVIKVYTSLNLRGSSRVDLSNNVVYIVLKKLSKRRVSIDRKSTVYRNVDQCSWTDCIYNHSSFGYFFNTAVK